MFLPDFFFNADNAGKKHSGNYLLLMCRKNAAALALTHSPPAIYTELTLQNNLAALYPVAPLLVNRICLPTASQHIFFNEQGQLFYRLQRNLFPFNLQLSNNIIAALSEKSHIETLAVFGVFDGEAMKKLLTEGRCKRLILWERDPWLLRLLLMRYDFVAEIVGGKIRFHLGIDLLKLRQQNQIKWLFNPFSEKLYHWEKKLVEREKIANRALVCTGGLFIDDICETLHDCDYAIYQIDVQALAVEEIQLALESFQPDFVFSVNYLNGLAELCHAAQVPLFIWEIDPATDAVMITGAAAESSAIFTYNQVNVQKHQSTGFRIARYLPLAANPQKRCFQKKTEKKYSAKVSFVGTSMLEQAQKSKQAFIDIYNSCVNTDAPGLKQAEEIVAACLDFQRQDFTKFLIPAALGKYAPDFHALCQSNAFSADPVTLLAESAAAEKRMNYLIGLACCGLKIWGDSGWELLENYGVKYMGTAGHFYELNHIYSASAINLDISRIYQMEIITMRVFDILACGGFLLTEDNAALREIFTPGKHLDTYQSSSELIEKTAYYLAHPQAARKIALAGQKLVHDKHKISDRINEIFKSAAAFV